MERTTLYVSIGIAVVAVLALISGGYGLYSLSNELKATRSELASTTESKDTRIKELETNLVARTDEGVALAARLRAEQMKNGTFETQLSTLSGTIGTLEKLAKTDSELLAKYSKVYFLNENYLPPKLSAIDEAFVSQKGRALEMNAEVEPFLSDLLKEAKDDGVDLLVASAYRSFGAQGALKSSYKVTFGAGANSFSADQGYSEHQLGTTVDFTTAKIGGGLAGFDGTPAFAWLNENAYKYGFILSYPKGNTYYQYEPWHWRFVGRDLAKDLREDKKRFYDLDQREIDEYLVSLFD
ncbi:MAG: D-alanyl-D-alanine carboxypeptidase [Parcubacteria bacterium C7867-004]|nr:MAG: D-alanyl-D-alanine carboxypeptidase [Parcubacteria bacterium C7867-004]